MYPSRWEWTVGRGFRVNTNPVIASTARGSIHPLHRISATSRRRRGPREILPLMYPTNPQRHPFWRKLGSANSVC